MESRNRLIRKKLSAYLKGKTVVLVGPASSILGQGYGSEIDKYDVVVRLNKGFPVPKKLTKDVGTRTDIIYNCMNPSDECGGEISIPKLKKQGVKFLVGAYPCLERVKGTRLRTKKDNLEFFSRSRQQNYPNFCHTDEKYFLEMWKIMKLPNTGTICILDLLRFKIKSLHITGITFFKGGYIRSYRNYDEQGILNHMARFNLHQPEKQLKYMTQTLSSDPRVTLDATLSEIIQEQLTILPSSSDQPTKDEPTTQPNEPITPDEPTPEPLANQAPANQP